MQHARQDDRQTKTRSAAVDWSLEELLIAKIELEKELAKQSRTIAQLKNRRAKDFERLAELTRTRDLLEGRLAAQTARTAEALVKIAERDKVVAEMDQRVGGARLLGGSEDDADESDNDRHEISLIRHPKEYLWWRQTVRAARKARAAGKLIEAQILFDAALLGRETGLLWTELAHVLRERKLFEAAEAAYDRALEFDGEKAENIFLAGYCAEMSGHKMQAARRYEAALEKDPKLASRYDHLHDYNARLFG
jgi:tetratricopeptide (TPR) repeat protein